ncbi:MAG: aldehyde ferredoxin oxidoreductase N-terminal domain-containing protein [Nitrososphaeria archaeon]
MGKILRVNLTMRQSSTEPLLGENQRTFLGGRGLAISILYRKIRPGIDPLGPDNKLVFATGPISAKGCPNLCSNSSNISSTVALSLAFKVIDPLPKTSKSTLTLTSI